MANLPYVQVTGTLNVRRSMIKPHQFLEVDAIAFQPAAVALDVLVVNI